MTEPDANQSARVEHNAAAQQFELRLGNLLCLLQYRLNHGKMIVYHTEVPQPLQNRGLAEQMTKAALEYARAENMRVEPRCPYTAGFLRQHPEYSDLL